MLGILVGAALLGLIIAGMEQDDFPGWWPMLICVLAAIIPTLLLRQVLPPQLGIVSLLGGAAVCAVAISRVCGMTMQRAMVAAGIYFAIQVGLSLACVALAS